MAKREDRKLKIHIKHYVKTYKPVEKGLYTEEIKITSGRTVYKG